MFTITPYSSVYALTAVISVFVALNVYRRRIVTGGKSLALMMFGITEWAFLRCGGIIFISVTVKEIDNNSNGF